MPAATSRYGLVWQGARYEGLVTVFLEHLGAFGGRILDADGRVVVDRARSGACAHLHAGCDRERRLRAAVGADVAGRTGALRLSERRTPRSCATGRMPGRCCRTASVAGRGPRRRRAVSRRAGRTADGRAGRRTARRQRLSANSRRSRGRSIAFLTAPEQMLERARLAVAAAGAPLALRRRPRWPTRCRSRSTTLRASLDDGHRAAGHAGLQRAVRDPAGPRCTARSPGRPQPTTRCARPRGEIARCCSREPDCRCREARHEPRSRSEPRSAARRAGSSRRRCCSSSPAGAGARSSTTAWEALHSHDLRLPWLGRRSSASTTSPRPPAIRGSVAALLRTVRLRGDQRADRARARSGAGAADARRGARTRVGARRRAAAVGRSRRSSRR